MLKHIGPRFNPYAKEKKKEYNIVTRDSTIHSLKELKVFFFLAVLNMILVR